MTKDMFYNKSGTLTTYAFNCGYLETKQVGEAFIQLYKDSCWHVRISRKNSPLVWECYENLTDARKAFRASVRKTRMNEACLAAISK